MSHPLRVRGLKFCLKAADLLVHRVAPLAGAWIEIFCVRSIVYSKSVAPLAGAWIEIIIDSMPLKIFVVAPLAGAWIEIPLLRHCIHTDPSHPLRVRGLKFNCLLKYKDDHGRTPCGCVD